MAEAGMNVSEQNFSFSDYVKRFAKPAVVRACCELLSQFEKNSETTNHYAVKLLHRITVDCKLPAVVFQASAFRTFQRILNSRDPSHKELQKFATYIVRKFVDVASRNKLVYMELLFWKTPKEAYEVEEGYGAEEPTPRGAKNRMWTEDQEQELRVLFEEFERDKPQPDMVDWIMQNLICKERSRHNVMKKLKQLGLKATKVPKPRKSKPKTNNQKAHEDLLGSDSDKSASGSQPEDSDHSSSENSESDSSQHRRAPYKSGALSINANRSTASASDSDDHSNNGILDEDNMDLLSSAAISHRNSIRSNSDSEESANGKSSDPLTRTQNSQSSSRSFNANDYSQKSRNSSQGEESFMGSLNSHKSPEPGDSRISDGSDDENSESHFLSALSAKSNEKSKKLSSKFTDSSDDEVNTLNAKIPKPSNSRVFDGSDDENSKSYHLNTSSVKSSEKSKKRSSSESSEEEGDTFNSKSPLQVISNLKEFSHNKNLTNVDSDSDEDSSRISKNVRPRKSLSRKRLRKVLSSDEENYETPDKLASPSIVLSSDKKRSRKVLSSDEEEENTRNEKRPIEIQSSGEETYATPSKKFLHQSKGGPIEIKSSDDETCITPSHKTKVTLISTETPKDKTSISDKINETPGSKMSLHLNSDSNDTPAKMSLHLNSDSNDTPNTKLSLQLDSDSVESPFKLNSSSFKTVNKTRILRIGSDSD